MTISNNLILKTLQMSFYLLPLSFIFGNLAINLMILLIIILGIIHFRKELLKFQNKYLLLLIILFFIMVLFSSYYKYFFIEPNKDAIKSILYLRYLFFLLIVKALIINNHIKINYFLNICFLLSFFISLDIAIQSLVGKNILGNNIIELIPPGINPGYPDGLKYHTGIFGKELIAGGFILMFSTIGLFAIFNLFTFKLKLMYLLLFSLLSIFFLITLILAGNRMPILIFILFLFLFAAIYKKKEKIYFISFAIVAFASLSFIILNTESLLKRAGSFKAGIPNPIVIIKELKKTYPNLQKYRNSGIPFHNLKEFKTTENYKNYPFFTGHLPIYITSIDLFMDKPLLGGGIKSFRNNCVNIIHLPNRVCENHPHNFILEILNDTGLIGFILLISFVFYLLVNNYKDYKSGIPEKLKISNWIYLAIILSILIYFFPIKSSGSFFSTFNSSFIYLILGISLGLNELKYKKRSK